MKLIKTDRGDIVQVDGEIKPWAKDACWCWGYRWNKNEGRFGKYCTKFVFFRYENVDESALTVYKPLDTGCGLE